MAGSTECYRNGRLGGKTHILKRIIAIIVLFFMIFDNAAGSSWEWKTYTSMHNIRALCESQRRIWCGTGGGLLAFDSITQTFESWTNTEGLVSNRITAVAPDNEGRVWIGFEDGMVQRYNPQTTHWFSIDDYRGNQITCLYAQRDTLLIGLDIGVSLYLVSREEVKETYHNFGFLSDVGGYRIDIPVNEILLIGQEIWVGTEEGLAYSRLDYTNLLDPENWSQMTVSHGIPDNHIMALAFMDNTLYAGTPQGVAAWDGEAWSVISNRYVYDLSVHDDRLYVAAENGVSYWSQGAWQSLPVATSPIYLLTSSSMLWGGSGDGLHAYSSEAATWTAFYPDCPSSNLISDVAVDGYGKVWCASRDKAFFRYDGSHWASFHTKVLPGTKNNDFVSVVVDPDNTAWFGSWGGGAVSVQSDSVLQFYRAENGYLAGISEDPNFAVVPDMAVDASGTLWLLNYRSVTNQPLIAITNDSQWIYYGLADGLPTTFMRVLTVDREGRKWIGTDSDGIVILNDNGTPSDKIDDPPLDRLTTANGLESNEITALAADRDGGVWIGTSEGLHYYFLGSVTRRYGLPSDNISALAVDGASNLWVGTGEGLCVFFENAYQCTLFTVNNSGLVNNEISALSLDPQSGMLYVGTSQGLSSLSTPFSEPQAELTNLNVYPNPFVPAQHGSVSIDNLAYGVNVHIYSASGYLVREFPRENVYGKRLLWEGTNQDGQPVPGGVYLIVVATEDGQNLVGKVAIVR